MPVIDFYFSGFVGIIVFIISLAFYFLPTIIALIRGHRNALAIFLLNFFLGWTFIGWVVSLVWSVTK
ncbi:MAG: superinfection immunity protein [Chloroflexota bacterium]